MIRGLLRWLWYNVPVFRCPKAVYSRIKLKRILTLPGPRLLNFGAGPYPVSGWVNADISPSSEFYIDARKPILLPEGSFDAVFSEHFLEHLEYSIGRRWMAECFRCLKAGGVFRVATSGLERLYEMYSGSSSHVAQDEFVVRHFSRFGNEIAKTYGKEASPHPCIVFNDKFRLWGSHRFIYDENFLIHTLKSIGFRQITAVKYGESRHEHLCNLEHHAQDDLWMKNAECIILEAIKPL